MLVGFEVFFWDKVESNVVKLDKSDFIVGAAEDNVWGELDALGEIVFTEYFCRYKTPVISFKFISSNNLQRNRI
jgi:hypothetical protein